MKPLLVRFSEAERVAVEAYRIQHGLRSEGAAVRHMVVATALPRATDNAALREVDAAIKGLVPKVYRAPGVVSTTASTFTASAPYGVDALTGKPLPKRGPLAKGKK